MTASKIADMSSPRIAVVGAALLDSLKNPTMLLCAQRSAPASLAGLWEFPGGKVEAGEGAQAALHRELSEELGVEAVLGAEILSGHDDGWPLNDRASMRVWLGEISFGVPAALEDHAQLRWVPLNAEALAALEWIPADFPIVDAVLAAVAPAAAAQESGATAQENGSAAQGNAATAQNNVSCP